MTLFPCAQIRRPAALHGLGGEREVKRHPRSLADATLSFDEATVGLYYGLGDGEAQPGACLRVLALSFKLPLEALAKFSTLVSG